MITEHTPEPWAKFTTTKHPGKTGYRYWIASYADGDGPRCICKVETLDIEERTANARRIVACVNACAGIAIDDLYETMLADRCDDLRKAQELNALSSEAHSLKRHEWEMLCAEQRQRAVVAEQQRDELAEALRKIAEVCNGYGDEAGWACSHARAALAKVQP